ncbi:MAG: Gfo/Idh/MocA family oxidoreductase [Chloroflexota bacterium]
MAPTKLIVIGTGGAGEWWVKGVIEAQELCTPVALVDSDPAHLQRALADNGRANIPTFTDYQQALREVEADAIVLVVPNPLHAAVATAALERGLHVLSEKPLASTMDEARMLQSLTTARRLRYAVSQNYRWTPQVAALATALGSGAVGTLSYVTYRFARSIALRSWRAEIPEVLLEDMAIHHFDLLRYLTGREARQVIARTFRPPWASGQGRPCAHVLMEFDGGLEVAYTGSWAPREAETSWHGESWYTGDQGALHFTGDAPPVLHRPGEAPVQVPEVAMPHAGPAHALRAFCQALQNGSAPECSIDDNIKSLALVQAAIASAAGGGTAVSPQDI